MYRYILVISFYSFPYIIIVFLSDLYFLDSFVDILRGSSHMRIQFLSDGSLFVLITTNKVVINK